MIVKMYYILILISNCLLLICRNVIDFCILQVYEILLLVPGVLLKYFLGFSTSTFISTSNNSLISSFSICSLFKNNSAKQTFFRRNYDVKIENFHYKTLFCLFLIYTCFSPLSLKEGFRSNRNCSWTTLFHLLLSWLLVAKHSEILQKKLQGELLKLL